MKKTMVRHLCRVGQAIEDEAMRVMRTDEEVDQIYAHLREHIAFCPDCGWREVEEAKDDKA